MCILIEHDNGYILYDTGSNMFSMEGYWPENLQNSYELHQTVEQNIEVQLAMCGVRKEQIDTVILSHMHFDHTGNIQLFKNADIYVPKDDFMMAQTTVRLCDDPDTYCGHCKNDMDAVYTNEVYGSPAKASGLLFDRTQFFKSIERVRMLQKNTMRS